MSARSVDAGRPDGAALVIAALLGGLAVVDLLADAGDAGQRRSTPRSGRRRCPTRSSGFLALLADRPRRSRPSATGVPEREADRLGADAVDRRRAGAADAAAARPPGFAIATGLLFAFTARGFGKGPLWFTVPLGIVVSLVIWLIFAGLLNLSLPAGPLEHLFL